MSIPTIETCASLLLFSFFLSTDANERNWHTKRRERERAPVTFVVKLFANILVCRRFSLSYVLPSRVQYVINLTHNYSIPFSCSDVLFLVICECVSCSCSCAVRCSAVCVSLLYYYYTPFTNQGNSISISFQFQFFGSFYRYYIRFGYTNPANNTLILIWLKDFDRMKNQTICVSERGYVRNICKRDWLNKLPKKWTGIMNCLNVRALTCWSGPHPTHKHTEQQQNMFLHLLLLSSQLAIDLSPFRSTALCLMCVPWNIHIHMHYTHHTAHTHSVHLSPFRLNWTIFETWLTLALFCVTKQTIRE